MRKIVSDRSVLEFVEHIYAAGCDPAQWPALTSRIHAALPGTSFSILLSIEGTTLGQYCAVSGIEDEHVRSYLEHYQFLNFYNKIFEKMPVGQVHTIGGVIDRGWVKKQAFYHEWLKPAGGFTHAAGLVIARDDSRMLRLSLDIPENMGHIEAPASQLLNRLGPHLSRAFTLNERLAAAVASENVLTQLLAKIDGAAAIVTQDRKITMLNAAAEALLRQATLVKSCNGNRLTFRDAGQDQAFRRALANACDIARADALTGFRIDSADGASRQVSVLPLRPAAGGEAGASNSLALIVLREANMAGVPPARMLQTMYGLTPAEAAVAVDIAAGLTLVEIAHKQGTSKLTLRNQLASVMAKMGVHRQAEVTATVLSLSPRLGASRPST